MASVLSRARTAARDPALAFDYLGWKFGFRRARTSFGGILNGQSYSEFRTIRNLSPSDEELSILSLCNNRGHFFDVGAHVGIWTVPIALSRPCATIHAFEAHLQTFLQLRSNIEENAATNVFTMHTAVADHDGLVNFQAPRNASVFGRIYSNIDSAGRYLDSECVEVPCLSLSTYCNERGIDQIEFLKIDVEGAELLVLRGLLPLLSQQRVRYIWTEIDSNDQIVAGNIAHLFALAERCGYSFYRATDLDTPVDIRSETNANMLMRPL
jgi:FkbM family methyltransferase